MKRMLIVAVIACMALLTSCGANRVSHTGDLTGSIYGVWALESKSVVPASTVGQDAQNQVDYSGVHFYLSLSEPRIALAKKGSFTQLDLKDVDVDGSQFSSTLPISGYVSPRRFGSRRAFAMKCACQAPIKSWRCRGRDSSYRKKHWA